MVKKTAKKTPFNGFAPRKPQRRKLSRAERERQEKFKRIIGKFRPTLPDDARYCIITAAGEMWKSFSEFSGEYGAKFALDMSDLPTGSAVVRINDAVELARMKRSSFYA